MEQCTELKIKFDAIEIRDCYISQHHNDNQLIYISSASSHLFQEQERAKDHDWMKHGIWRITYKYIVNIYSIYIYM